MAADRTTNWRNPAIICPVCGNSGGDDGAWMLNGSAPFRLVEDVERSWVFTARTGDGSQLLVVANSDQDHINWEGGANRRLECVQCLAQFPLPSDVVVEFE